MRPAKAEKDMNWVALGPREMLCKTGSATITTYQLVQRKGVDPQKRVCGGNNWNKKCDCIDK